jgi:hypothetical protein
MYVTLLIVDVSKLGAMRSPDNIPELDTEKAAGRPVRLVRSRISALLLLLPD